MERLEAPCAEEGMGSHSKMGGLSSRMGFVANEPAAVCRNGGFQSVVDIATQLTGIDRSVMALVDWDTM